MARQKTGCRNRGTLGASPAPLYDRVEGLRPAVERPAPAAPCATGWGAVRRRAPHARVHRDAHTAVSRPRLHPGHRGGPGGGVLAAQAERAAHRGPGRAQRPARRGTGTVSQRYIGQAPRPSGRCLEADPGRRSAAPSRWSLPSPPRPPGRLVFFAGDGPIPPPQQIVGGDAEIVGQGAQRGGRHIHLARLDFWILSARAAHPRR